MVPSDRRRFQRYAVRSPLGARVAGMTAAVLDASEKGVRISHEGRLPNIGTTCRLILQSAMGPITVDCEVVHTRHETSARSSERKDEFQSGLHVVATDFQSEQRFRELLRSLMGPRSEPAGR